MANLDGLTILRYGHLYDTRGGMEEYVSDLNRALHARNEFTTWQIELTSNPERLGKWEDGRVHKVSLFVEAKSHQQSIAGIHPTGPDRLAHTAKSAIAKSTFLYWLVSRFYSLKQIPRRAGEPENVGTQLRQIHRVSPIDLVCLHSIGGADASEILATAQELGVPSVYVHHFSNDRLGAWSVRRQLEHVSGVAGVSGRQVPPYLIDHFCAVGDGVDTDFYQSTPQEILARTLAPPIIFLPARLTPAKGQMRLLRVAGELRRRGRDFRVVFAGRVDSEAFADELATVVREEKLENHVTFDGALGRDDLRARYAQSSVVAFPTLHHEGLPRILLEAQAMSVPSVVYDSGGSGEGVVNEETGFVVAAGDIRSFGDRLDQLLSDGRLRTQFGRAGRRLAVECYSTTALAAKHETFYNAVLDRLKVQGKADRETVSI